VSDHYLIPNSNSQTQVGHANICKIAKENVYNSKRDYHPLMALKDGQRKLFRVLLFQGPLNGFTMVLYDSSKRLFGRVASNFEGHYKELSWIVPFAAGGCASVVDCLVSSTISARLQQGYQGQVSQKELFRLLGRNVPYTALYYGWTETINRVWTRSDYRSKTAWGQSGISWIEGALTGALGGLCALSIAIPMEFVTKRVRKEWEYRHSLRLEIKQMRHGAMIDKIRRRCHAQLREELEKRIPTIVLRRSAYSILKGVLGRTILS
jgi:hypothetical protein